MTSTDDEIRIVPRVLRPETPVTGDVSGNEYIYSGLPVSTLGVLLCFF